MIRIFHTSSTLPTEHRWWQRATGNWQLATGKTGKTGKTGPGKEEHGKQARTTNRSNKERMKEDMNGSMAEHQSINQSINQWKIDIKLR